MVKSPQSRSAKMPMLELIFVIGLFVIISVFLLQLFLSANMLQSRARDEGKAIVQSEKIAEIIKAADSFEEAKKECHLLEFSGIDEKSRVEKIIMDQLKRAKGELIYTLYFDKNWEESTTEVMYTAIVSSSVNEEYSPYMEEYDVYVFRLQGYASMFRQKESEELYHLQFSKYRN